MAFEKELLVATQAVRKASLLTKRIQAQVIAHKDSTTITKSDNSPVTVGDYAAQTIIINAIKANFPNDEIVGEESSDGLENSFVSEILREINENDKIFHERYEGTDQCSLSNKEFPLSTIQDVKTVIDFGNSKGGNKGRIWCLDPIDGTKGFLRGEQFAVCLGLIIDGVPKVGVIGCPNLRLQEYGSQDIGDHKSFGYLFRAVKGFGSYYAPAADVISEDPSLWIKIHARDLKTTSEMISLEGVEKSHSSHDEQSQIKKALNVSKSLHLDSQVKYCLLALGLGDLYLRLPIKLDYQEKIWDHAAGNVILLEAGGIHTLSLIHI